MNQRIACGFSIWTNLDTGSKYCFPSKNRRYHDFIGPEKETHRGSSGARETDPQDGIYSFVSSVFLPDVLPNLKYK